MKLKRHFACITICVALTITVAAMGATDDVASARAAAKAAFTRLGYECSIETMVPKVTDLPGLAGRTIRLSDDKWSVYYSVPEVRIAGIYNNERSGAISKHQARTGQRFFSTDEQAWQVAERLLPKVWSGPTLRRRSMKWTPDLLLNQAPRSDASRLTCIFADTPSGTSLFGANGVTVVLDVQDGTLLSLTMKAGWEYGPYSATFGESSARSLAVQAMSASRSVSAADITGVELDYVNSNSFFGGSRHPGDPAKRLRYAYVVSFGKDAVWIDAADGRVLGGRLTRSE